MELTTLGSVVKVRAPGWSDPAGQKLFFAEVAELVDALASGASGGNPVEVQVLSSVPRRILSPFLSATYLLVTRKYTKKYTNQS